MPDQKPTAELIENTIYFRHKMSCILMELFNILRNQKGFSLMEIMVAMTIIAIITGISLFSIGSAQTSSRDSTRRADLKVLQGAIQKYYADNNYYPSDSIINNPGQPFTAGQQTYMSSIPSDPAGGKKYCYLSQISANNTSACSTNTCQFYKICANLENPDPTEVSSCSCGTPAANYNYQVTPL